MSLYHKIAEKLQFIIPEYYKKRFFKKLKNLDQHNLRDRNIEPELLWLKDFIRKNDVVIDIGANVGSYLYLLENKIKHENFYAFEPNKKLYFRLKRLFPGMRIFPFALSDLNTEAEFKIPVINGKKINSRGTLQTDFKENGEEKNHKAMVKVIKLDDWASLENFERINFIKIDVEGNEMHTLRGAMETIKKYKPVLMVELEQRHHKTPIFQYILEISDWGYHAKYVDRKSFSLLNFTEKIVQSQGETDHYDKNNYINNIIFIPIKNTK